MTAGIKIDRQKIHQALWEATDRNGKIKLFQKEWAARLDISHFLLCRVLREFEEEGRVKKIGARYRNVGIYTIRDPAEFPQE